MTILRYNSAIALMLSIAPVCLAGSGAAQSSFENGSFGGASGGAQATAVPVQNAGNGDGFGGSFGGGGNPQQSQETLQPAVNTGGSGFDGGSFDPDFVVPTPQLQPAPQPQPDPAPVPKIDPQILAFETRDFGIPPTTRLRADRFHAQTPTSVPGAQTVSTEGLAEAINGGMEMVLVDVLDSNYTVPGAYVAFEMSYPGSFTDRYQQQTEQWLNQVTNGQTDMPVVVFCSDPMCWLSYNGTLRAVAAGYTNVYWYRGGIQAWEMAGLALNPTPF